MHLKRSENRVAPGNEGTDIDGLHHNISRKSRGDELKGLTDIMVLFDSTS